MGKNDYSEASKNLENALLEFSKNISDIVKNVNMNILVDTFQSLLEFVKDIPDDIKDTEFFHSITKVDVTFENDTVWLSIAQMADLFRRDRSVISRHIKNIFEEGELLEESNVQNLHIANSDKPVKFYNLDVIISVGYRVKSQRGVQFRIWAANILKEYMKKGFAMDDERLKKMGGGGYFKELLERIRDIRASEKIFYRQILEIYATNIDYNQDTGK